MKSTQAKDTTVIEPLAAPYFPDLRELWGFRNLFKSLVWRNFRVRYRNTALGVAWVILQPLALMFAFVQVFGIWAGFDVGDIPYSIHALSGLVILFFINRIISLSVNVVRENQSLTRKVYFPKLVLPCSLVTSELADLAVGIALLLFIMLVMGIYPAPTAPLALVFLGLLFAWGFALSVLLAALGIRFRDLSMIVPIFMLVQMYLTPIIYPLTDVPPENLIAYSLNPLVGIVSGFRWAMFGTQPFFPWMVGISVIETVVLGLFGLVYFTRTERDFNDFL